MKGKKRMPVPRLNLSAACENKFVAAKATSQRIIEWTIQVPQTGHSEPGELLTVVACGAWLTITIPPGVDIAYIGDQPYEYAGPHLRIFLPELVAGEERMVHLRVTTPAGIEGECINVCGDLCYADDDQNYIVTVHTALSLLYCDEPYEAETEHDAALLERAYLAELEMVAMYALNMVEQEGQQQNAIMLLRRTLERSQAYVPAALIVEYTALAERLQQRIAPDAPLASTRLRRRSTPRSYPALLQTVTAILQHAGYQTARTMGTQAGAGFLVVQNGSRVEVWHHDGAVCNHPQRQEVYERAITAYATVLQEADLACITSTNKAGDPCVRFILPIMPAGVRSYAAVRERGDTPLLSIQHQNAAGYEIVWEKQKMTVGRYSHNDIIIPHREASRQHANLQRQADTFYICDLESTNGTFVNGTFLNGSLRLCDQDRILIADTTIVFQCSSDEHTRHTSTADRTTER